MEFSDKKSETDLKSERVKAVSISVAKENQGEIAEKMSLYEATCVPTLKLRALLDIFLTIQTMSTRQFWVVFFFLCLECFCKTKIKTLRSINASWVLTFSF